LRAWGIHGGDGVAASVVTSALIYSQHNTLENGSSTRSLQPNKLSNLAYQGVSMGNISSANLQIMDQGHMILI